MKSVYDALRANWEIVLFNFVKRNPPIRNVSLCSRRLSHAFEYGCPLAIDTYMHLGNTLRNIKISPSQIRSACVLCLPSRCGPWSRKSGECVYHF